MPEDGDEKAGWLPPQPPGPEPDLGQAPPPPPPPPPPSRVAQPPPPPTAGYQQYQQQPTYQQYPVQLEPGNGNAVAALVLSLVGVGILLATLGLGFILSIPCGALAIFFGKKGRDAVDSGKTRKNRGVAHAGFIVGIVVVALSVLAAAGWIALIVSDPHFFDDFNTTNESDPFGVNSVVLGLARIATLLAA